MMFKRNQQDRSPVSLTGHFTGYVWCSNQLSPPAFGSLLGGLMYYGSRPIDWLSNQVIGLNLETMLLQRHYLIDDLVNKAIDDGYTQIVEIASGLSARGMRILEGHPYESLRYIEADLPDMVGWKRTRLQKADFYDERHRLLECNILREEGELSIEHILEGLDHTQKTLVITEGLVNYFPLKVIEEFWKRLALALSTFEEGRYLFEVWPKVPDHPAVPWVSATQKVIELVTRQSVPLHFGCDHQIEAGLMNCGFAKVKVMNPDEYSGALGISPMRGGSLFRVVDAGVI